MPATARGAPSAHEGAAATHVQAEPPAAHPSALLSPPQPQPLAHTHCVDLEGHDVGRDDDGVQNGKHVEKVPRVPHWVEGRQDLPEEVLRRARAHSGSRGSRG